MAQSLYSYNGDPRDRAYSNVAPAPEGVERVEERHHRLRHSPDGSERMSDEAMTEQLNRSELARIQSGNRNSYADNSYNPGAAQASPQDYSPYYPRPTAPAYYAPAGYENQAWRYQQAQEQARLAQWQAAQGQRLAPESYYGRMAYQPGYAPGYAYANPGYAMAPQAVLHLGFGGHRFHAGFNIPVGGAYAYNPSPVYYQSADTGYGSTYSAYPCPNYSNYSTYPPYAYGPPIGFGARFGHRGGGFGFRIFI